MIKLSSIIFQLLYIIVILFVSGESSSIKNILDLETKISRLTIYKQDKIHIYVTSLNRLYKIVDYQNVTDSDDWSSSLKIEIKETTGPKMQKLQCTLSEPISSSNSCTRYVCDDDPGMSKVALLKNKPRQASNVVSVDNENRLLLIDPVNKNLIECGTIDYGGCRLRQLSDLKIIGCNFSAPVIPFNSASGVVVSSSIQESSTSRLDESSLYLMVSNEYDPSDRITSSDFPVFSIRNLASTYVANSEQPQLQIKQPLFQSKQLIENMIYDQNVFTSDFHMRIIYSFKHNGFIYFLFTITNKVLSDSYRYLDDNVVFNSDGSNTNSSQSSSFSSKINSNKIVTRLLRVCDSKWSSDSSYSRSNSADDMQEQFNNIYSGSSSNSATITETIIDCDDQITGDKYNLLQSAHFHKFDDQIVSAENDNSILFLTYNSTVDNSAKSVVCSVKIKEMDDHFVNMMQKCLDSDNSYAGLVSPYSNINLWRNQYRCSQLIDQQKNFDRRSLNERKLFCHNDYFNYLNSRQSLSIKSISSMTMKMTDFKPITSIVSLNTYQKNKLVLVLSTFDANIHMFTYNLKNNEIKKYDQINLLQAPQSLLMKQIKHMNSSALSINLAVIDTSNSKSLSQRSLLVTYDRYLYKINLQNCEQFETCDTCLGLKNRFNSAFKTNEANPFCGWCIYEQKCTLKQTCTQKYIANNHGNIQDYSRIWLDSQEKQECPYINHVKPSKYLNPLIIQSSTNNDEQYYLFNMNIDLVPNNKYYCDISTELIEKTNISSFTRLPAVYVNSTMLKCNLTPIKQKFLQQQQQQQQQHYHQHKLNNSIKKKFSNVSVELRGSYSSASFSTSLLASTNLFAFNCSYFKDCSQCLDKRLMGSCVWCGKNSKCVFSDKLVPHKSSSSVLTNSDFVNGNPNSNECPDEVEYYQRTPFKGSDDVCTSFYVKNIETKKSKIEIAYSGDSKIGQYASMLIRNRHQSYQNKFMCLFTTSPNVKHLKNILTIDDKPKKLTRSKIEFPISAANQLNDQIIECSYSPYNDIDQLKLDVALQTIYMSVWWSPSTPYLSNFNYDLDSGDIFTLNGWTQVKFQEISENDNIDEDSIDDENIGDNLNSTMNFIEINIINCKVKASSCGKCMDQQLIDLGCGWCKTTSKCTMQKDCPISKTISSYQSNWMNDLNDFSESSYCSNPSIIEMKPTCGPRFGAGTKLTIEGDNLGRTTNDIRVKMRPTQLKNLDPDLECSVIHDLYQKASKIVCKTQPINQDASDEYTVYVETNTKTPSAVYSSFNRTRQFLFKYVEPEIISIEPLKGIKSGGTLLKIIGKNLSCGSQLNIRFKNTGGNCSIVNISSSNNNNDVVYCRVPMLNEWITGSGNQASIISSSGTGTDGSAKSKSQSEILIRMDDYEQIPSKQKFKFEYVDDPKISSVERLSTIASGGLNMTIRGDHFDYIQTTHLILSPISIIPNQRGQIHEDSMMDTSNINIFKSKCNIVNSTLIQCLIPQIKDKRLTPTNLQASNNIVYDSLNYYFYIQFNEISNKYANQQMAEFKHLRVYQDPVFDDAQIFSDKTPIILINGENLLRGVNASDYKVWVGLNNECNITSITMKLIACILPDHNNINSNQNTQLVLDENKSKTKKRSANNDERKSSSSSRSYEVRIQIGQTFTRTIGFLKYEKDIIRKYDSIELKYILIAACLMSFVLFLSMISCFIILKQRQNKQIRQLKRMQTEFENLEMRVARECKEAFTELQMDIGELANTLNQTGAPFNDFQTYCMKILFPNASETEKYYLTTPIDLRLSSANKENVKNGVLMFSQLILNKKFLLTFIHTLEADTHTFLLQDRVNLASYLSICLHDRMDYFTDILMTLLGELIEKIIDTKNNPKILLRRNESVAEKMLTNWFAFLLYDFIKDCAGTPLYILFLSIKQQIYKGPVDAITCEARYSLSEDKLIRQSIDYETITIRVQLQDFDDITHELTVKVLNCDTISQVKEKILDAFFKGYPFSKRPNGDDLDLVFIPSEWNKNSHGRLILYDEDKTCKIDNDDYKRLNTLSHYKISTGALLVLVSRQSYQLIHSSNNDACNSYTMLDTAKNSENMTLLSKSSKGSSSPPTYSKLSSNALNDYNANNGIGIGIGGGVYSAMNSSSIGLTESILNQNNSTRLNTNLSNYHKSGSIAIPNNTSSPKDLGTNKIKRYHLIKPNDSHHSTTPNIKDDKSKQQIAAKLVSEVYLTRLLATKGGMQSYVDDFFESVFSTAHGSNVLPFAIKYLFDFLDEQANIHGISDMDVVYTWKSNSLPLRFWVNIIKNPDFVFDIFKSNIVDASLSVIASTFMDSCSQSRLDLNKESPSGKLLFYKEVHKYRKWVESYYSEIKSMPKVNDQDLSEMLGEESKKRQGSFNKNNALYRLYNDYVKKYRIQIENSLTNEYQEPSVMSVNKHLNYRLQQVIYLMDAIEV